MWETDAVQSHLLQMWEDDVARREAGERELAAGAFEEELPDDCSVLKGNRGRGDPRQLSPAADEDEEESQSFPKGGPDGNRGWGDPRQ